MRQRSVMACFLVALFVGCCFAAVAPVSFPISDREITILILPPGGGGIYATALEGKPIKIEIKETGEIYILVPLILDEETTCVKFSMFNESLGLVERFVASSTREYYLENTKTSFSLIAQAISKKCNATGDKLGDAECSGGNCSLTCEGGFIVTGCRVLCEAGCCYCPPCQKCPLSPPK